MSQEVFVFPVSFAQQRLWFLEQLTPGNPVYNIARAMRLKGMLQPTALLQSLQVIADRHEILRTTFEIIDGEPMQMVAEATIIELPCIDLTPHPSEQREAEARRIAAAEARRAFDLAAGPLLRATLVRLDHDEHWLILTVHHMIFDGWSYGIFCQELAALYRHFSGEAEDLGPAGTPLPIQYADYAVWQRDWLQGEILERQLAYWKNHLADAPTVLALPTDHPRPSRPSLAGAVAPLALSPVLTTALRQYSQGAHATTFMTLLAAFAVVLARHSGQPDVVIGVPVAGRTRPETAGLIGFFVNMLPLRIKVGQARSFGELVAAVRTAALGGYAQQDLPFEMLVEVLAPERSLHHAPIFQVACSLQSAAEPIVLPGLTVDIESVSTATAKLDLTLNMTETATAFVGGLEYNTDLFESATIARLAGHVVQLLEGVLATPDAPLATIPLLTTPEYQQLVYAWNATSADYADEQTLHTLFELHAARRPDHVAVVCEGEQLTYAELNCRANQLAHHLRTLGVGGCPQGNMRVGLCFQRSIELIVGMLAVLKSGGAYVPLDPSYPAERIAVMLEDAATPVVLTQHLLADHFDGLVPTVLSLDADWDRIAAAPETNLSQRSLPDSPAYVIFTSGSTGRPKGVLVPHRGVINLLADFDQRQPLTADDRASLWTSISFDVSVYETFAPLTAGATLYLIPEAVRTDEQALIAWLIDNGITSSYLPPFLLPALAAWLESDQPRPVLRRLLVGVEPIAETLLSGIAAQLPALRIINGYGPTEASICATLYACQAAPAAARTTPIGRPVQNLQLYLLDAQGQLVPLGVAGELYIGGVGLAHGYHNRPDLTAEKFVPDPFGGSGGRLYRTGDLARYLPDGNLMFLGRQDHQVKVRGFRIELGEIEATLRRHAEVQEAVVLAREDSPGDVRLVAYVEQRTTEQRTKEQSTEVGEGLTSSLRQFLRQTLPEYMIPSAFVVLERLPQTPNGKVDRKALPAPSWELAPGEGAEDGPQSPVEELLAALWTDLLPGAPVHRQANFFALGGHSLLATRMLAQVRTLFAVELPLHVVFEHATLADLAQAITEQQRAATPTLPPIQPLAAEQAPLSFAQQRVWFVEQLVPGTPAYTIPLALRLHGALDSAALRQSLQQLVDRHAVLRTTFVQMGDQPQQVIAPTVVLDLREHDLRDATTDPDTTAQARVRAAATQPFDLAHGPLIRAQLVRLAAQEWLVLLTLHHSVADGWSLDVLWRELAQGYRAQVTGTSTPLPALPIQYADYAVWQRDWLHGEILEQQLAYWKTHLADAPTVLALPTDHPRPSRPSLAGGVAPLVLSPVLTTALRKFSQGAHATTFMTLLAAFAVVLARHSGQPDLVIGVPVAGRTRPETAGLIGFFVNMLPLHIKVGQACSFGELVAAVRTAALAAYAQQDLPFEMLVEALTPERSLHHAPLVQVACTLRQSTELELPGLTVRQEPVPQTTSKLDLTLGLVETPTGLVGGLEYSTDLFEAATIGRLAGHLVQVLEQVLAAPDAPLYTLPLLSPPEYQQLVHDWNRSEAEYPRDAAVHQLIEAQAERTPDRPAIVYEGASLSYAELNARANQLAHHLRVQGVGPDVLVALMVERSLEMIVGMLAILKAGGAYVPLDPAYPADRLQYMLSHSRAPVILTQDRLVERLPEHTAQVFRLDADWSTLAAQPTTNPLRTAQPDNLAYIIFTSGSTGRPKGVMVKQQGLINLVHGLRAYFDDPAVHNIGLITSISFDISVNQIFPTLFFGRTLHIIPDPVKYNSRALLGYLHEHQIHLLDAVPSYMQAVLNEVAPEQPANALRYLLIGGEKIEQRLLQSVFGQLGHAVEIVNIYGLTEISDINALGVIRAKDIGKPITVGKPLQNNRIYILDQHNQLNPIGVAGEVCIAGDSVSRGYLFRPELTAERFVVCPFEDGQIMVRTGDLGRWRADGTIEILGRIDHQVKIQGFRIETGEIEAVLAQHPQVKECVVVAREDAVGADALVEKRLAGYITLRIEASAPTPSDLRQFLGAHLPHYMIPSAFVVLERLPQTPNGKVDRKALPMPQWEQAADGSADGPQSPVEELLAALWVELLGVPVVARQANFFALGGHSLLATRMLAQVRTLFAVEVPLHVVFEHATLADLAQAITEQQRAATPTLPPIQPLAAEQAPLSFAQQRVWFVEQLVPGTPAYTIPLALRLHGALDSAALRQSLQQLVDRHAVLRTTFEERDGQAWQVIAPTLVLDLREHDLRDATTDPDTTAQARVRAAAVQPFDLAHGPLIRAQLVRLAAQEWLVLLTLHHSVADGWSLDVLWRELAQGYRAQVTGTSTPLPALPIQYADYAVWQRDWLHGEILEQQLVYWKNHLADAPTVLALPTDHPRPSRPSLAGAVEPLALAPGLTTALREFSQGAHATTFMTLLAAFAVVLARHSGQPDLVIGVPVAGRTRPETAGLIGFFVNMLPLRIKVGQACSFGELVAAVRTAALAAYAQQDLPFEMLVEALTPERSLHHAPLVQVACTLRQAGAQLELPGVTVRQESIPHTTAKLDLTLNMAETATGLVGGLEYSTDLFEAATIGRLAGHLVQVLDQVLVAPDAPLHTLALLSPPEYQQLVYDWNATHADYPADLCIHELVAARAAQTSEAIAIVCGDQQLTYQALDWRANQLAHVLRQRGVGPEVCVGLCLDRSLDLVVAQLAVLKAGGAFLPLDPAAPSERFAYILRDAQVALLLTTEAALSIAPPDDVAVLWLDRDAALLDDAPTEPLGSVVTPANLAYVIYTSGSTGRPKGVAVPHAGLVNLAIWHQRAYSLSSSDRATLVASPAFDASVWEIWPYLVSGARIVIPDEATRSDPAALAAWLCAQEITISFLPTALAEAVMAQTWPATTALRALLVGGDQLHPIADDLPFPVYNHYGPTETTVVASWQRVEPDSAATLPPIGRPIDNIQAYLLDAHYQPVPIGVVGEIYIGGTGVARGYFHQPALTAERFIPNPFAQIPGARLYRTGDLARYLPDGSIEFGGRIDHQVKLRGFRIELGEIEAALHTHPALAEAVVIVREDMGDPRLVAYVVQNKEQRTENSSADDCSLFSVLGSAELRQHLVQRLPAYMIPSAFVVLDALPMTSNGKLDRRALPQPELHHAEIDEALDTPRTPAEDLVANIWANVLGVEQVSLHANFFELGGHSLLATQVISQIRQIFQVELPLSTVFEAPTVAELTAQIEAAQRDGAGLELPPIVPVTTDAPQPLSFAQERLWILDQLEPGTALYNIPATFRLLGSIDVAALEQSFSEILRRHATLRTRFITSNGVAAQVIDPAAGIVLARGDLSSLPPDVRQAEAQRLIQLEGRQPFDLATGPLLRCTLLKLHPEGTRQEHLLLLTMHHIVSDGWSMGVLIRELVALYTAFSNSQQHPESTRLAPLPIQYSDYALWQREWLTGDVLDRQVDYWKQRLQAAPPVLELPTDWPRPPARTFDGAHLSLRLPAALSDELRLLSRKAGGTLFMTLLAAFKILLARTAGQDDIVVGTPIAGRNRAETEHLIGFFLNTLVLRTGLDGNPSFQELLSRVRETTLGAYAHQDVPFEKLLDELRPERDLSHTPLFQVFFNMLNLPDMRIELPGLTTEALASADIGSKFDLTLYAQEQSAEIALTLVYNANLFRASRMREMLAQLQHLLSQIAATPGASIGSYSLVTPSAQPLLPDPTAPLDATWYGAVHTLFAQQAERAPQQIAVIDPLDSWSYAELNARANQIAHYLISGGITPEDVVAIYSYRSAALICAVLGVLKAGAAYTILDPAYPTPRLLDYVEIAQPRGWIALEAAGRPAPELATLVEAASCCRLQLTQTLRTVAHPELDAQPTSDPQVAVGPDSAAIIAFTSGSTGKPKGIVARHGPLTHFLPWVMQTFGLSETDRYSMISGLAHDPLQRDMFTPLCSGATVCVPQPEAIVTPGQLAAWMRRQNITIANLTPALGQLLTETGTDSHTSDQQIPSLRYTFIVGDVLTMRDVARIRSLAPNITCINFYGSTETQRAVGYYLIPTGDDRPPTAIEQVRGKEILPLGRGMQDVQVLVLTPERQMAGIGEVGEIYMRSPHLARGYLGNPALTEERFLSNPFTDVAGDRLYRTGDLGRYRPDGNVEFVGRVDHQVKIRGFRIELGEIEAVLGQHPSVREAVVMAREESSGEKRLVAYVVEEPRTKNQEQSSTAALPSPAAAGEGWPAGRGEGLIPQLRSHVGAKLPNYMIPASFVLLEALPLTPNGKLDRRALQAMPLIDADSTEHKVAPRTPEEAIIAELWAELLQLDAVGVHDNFFNLGGHSLMATRLIARLRSIFQIELPLSVVFDAPTVADMTEIVEDLLIQKVESLSEDEIQRLTTNMFFQS